MCSCAAGFAAGAAIADATLLFLASLALDSGLAFGVAASFAALAAAQGTDEFHCIDLGAVPVAEGAGIERLFMLVILVCFGAAIAEGTIFQALTWPVVFLALAIVLILRPLAGMVNAAIHAPDQLTDAAAAEAWQHSDNVCDALRQSHRSARRPYRPLVRTCDPRPLVMNRARRN